MTDEQFLSIHESLARLETQMESLCGNGQPGRIQLMENDISDLQKNQNRGAGVFSAFVILATGWEFFREFFHR